MALPTLEVVLNSYTTYPLKLFSLGVLLVLFAACTSVDSPQFTRQAKATHVVTLELKEGDTKESIQALYGGDILAWTDSHAVVRYTRTNELSTAALADGEVEINEAAFSMLGEAGFNGSRAWAGGSRAWADGSRAWAGGSRAWADGSRAWADGEFAMMPENTQAWLQIGLDQAYQLAPRLGYGVKVAVIDTGIDLNHPAIVEALAPKEEWLDIVDGDNYPQEEGVLGEGGYGHGTVVAGIIRQIAPAATILPIRILGENGVGYLSDLVEAISWAKQQGADVINMSLGSTSYSFAVDMTMSDAAKALTMVSSTGNTGDDQVVFPAYKAPSWISGYNRLSVTSVDSNDIKSSFATYGSSVELAAPGEYIWGPAPDFRMASWSGTSMATPVAAGALALALGETFSVKSYRLLEKLQITAAPIDGLAGNAELAGNLGSGRIDLAAFLNCLIEESIMSYQMKTRGR